MNNKVVWADELLSTNLSCTKIENCCDHCNISNDIGNMIFFLKKIQPNHSKPNCAQSQYPSDNIVDNIHKIGNKVNNEKL